MTGDAFSAVKQQAAQVARKPHRPYAYVCTLCHHLATRHGLVPGATSAVEGPYACREHGCECRMSQLTSLAGIDKHTAQSLAGHPAGASSLTA